MFTTTTLTAVVQLATASVEHRLSPDLDASPLVGRELEMRKRRITHSDVELSLLVSRAIAHRRGDLVLVH